MGSRSVRDVSPAVRQALELLAADLRSRLEHTPGGHLLAGRADELELSLVLPADPLVTSGARAWEHAARDLDTALERGLAALLRHRAAWLPGHAVCLRCPQAPCEHSRPAGPREVFVGFGPTGIPRFVDLAQWLLERRDPQLERLYGANGTDGQPVDRHGRPGDRRRGRPTPPPPPLPLVARRLEAADLIVDLLPAYERADAPCLLGAVVAGWYRFASPAGPAPVALTVLALATRRGRNRWRLAVDAIARGPEGELAAQLSGPLGVPPWAEDLAWTEHALRQLERHPLALADLERRAGGVLGALARRLEHSRRARERRTQHGEERHQQGDRPTRLALADVARAGPEQILRDVRRQTLVVLGERGRAHVFNRAGRLVTSLRTTPEDLARRRDRGLWLPASPEEALALRRTLTQPAAPDADGTSAAVAAPPREPTAARGDTGE